MAIDYQKRLHKLRKKISRKKLGGVLISQPENRRYLCGYSGCDHGIAESAGVLLIPKTGPVYLLTDFRFKLQAENETTGIEVALYPKGLTELLSRMLPDLGIAKLGFESHYTLHSAVGQMTEKLNPKGVSLCPTERLVESLREIKDEDEIAALKKSVQLNEKVFEEVYASFSDYDTEIDVAIAVETAMRRHGAERPSFETIVATGANGARPHAVPSTDLIRKNKSLTIDMGLILNGYCSDMTRNFVPQKPTKRYLKLHRIVRKAQLAGMDAIRAGIRGCDADKCARTVIVKAGYGNNFGHSLGHGVGLAVHEAPSLSPRSRKKLKAGMIVTVEPGIYVPGWGGIRLENMGVVREDGFENFNNNSTWLDI
ncbi:MAG: Xaa-Pro aminopeptidase [Desulforhopalus sp.]|jgi:Xaa-Pro aminopeptidase